MPDRILRLREVLARVAIGKTTLWALVARGDFPAPLRLTARARGWHESAVDAWIAARGVGSAVQHDEEPARDCVAELDLAGPFAPSPVLLEILAHAPRHLLDSEDSEAARAIRACTVAVYERLAARREEAKRPEGCVKPTPLSSTSAYSLPGPFVRLSERR